MAQYVVIPLVDTDVAQRNGADVVAFENREYIPKQSHLTVESARRRAEDLAKEHPGVPFALCVTTEVFESVPKIVKKLFDQDGQLILEKVDG